MSRAKAGEWGMIPAGATIGVLGGGQLGRMLARCASRLGYVVRVYSEEAEPPAAEVAREHVRGSYEDGVAVERFASGCDVVTLEFENVPVSALEAAGRHVPVRPGAEVLAIAQDRLRERAFLDGAGVASSPHAAVRREADLAVALERVGTPAVLKAARFGYDGRGQRRVESLREAREAWGSLGGRGALCERWVEYRCELSVLVARAPRGEARAFGPIENRHVNHILDCSLAPARVDMEAAGRSVELAVRIAEELELEGLMCVEMFQLADGGLLVNELAPRAHNSGHLTIEACDVSQFEQQVRAVCDLPLAPMELRSPGAMVNLLGDLWEGGEPRWEEALGEAGVFLHLYGKREARAGRKMGHLTVLGEDAGEAAERALEIRERLRRGSRIL